MWKYKDPQTGELKALKIDERFIKSVEERLGLKTEEQRESFRTSIRKIYGQKISHGPELRLHGQPGAGQGRHRRAPEVATSPAPAA